MKSFLLVLFLCFTVQSAFAQNSATKDLYALFDAEWEWSLKESPTFASYLGDKRYNDRWSDLSLAAIEARQKHRLEALEKLKRINRADLSAADRLNYDFFKKETEEAVEAYKFKSYLMPINQRGGIQTADELAEFLQFTTVKDYDNWLARINAFPAYMEQTLTLMREGKRQNLMWAKKVMERVPAQIDKQITPDAESNAFYAPFKTFPKDISESEQTRLRAAAKEAIASKVIPSYKKLKEYFTNEYLPASYTDVGIWQRPDGADYYAFLARSYTTTNLTPQQIHEKGLSEVARIRAEMEKIKTQVGFKGTLPEFFQYLRTDEKFFYKTPAELIKRLPRDVEGNRPEL